MKTCITNCTIHTGDDILVDKNILVENGIIIAINNETPDDAALHNLGGMHISPGFIDIHINGGEKYFFTQSPTEEALLDICSASLQYGVTHLLPCLISSGQQTILKAIETTRAFMQQHKTVLGLHIEGPFINPEKRGAHVKTFIHSPTNKELEEIIHHGKDVVKLMTIAPECFTDEQINLLQDAGIVLSAGHSTLTCKQAQYYFSKGITLVTHLYNAMTQFGHREPGLVGAVFQDENVFAPIILDGQHCDYLAAQVAYKMKGDHLFLISDAAFLGRKVTAFSWGEFNMKLTPDGHYRNSDGNLACASISMAEAIRNAKQQLPVSTADAIKMATSIPAKAIRMDDKVGFIKPGYPASFVCFDEALETISPLVC